MMAELERRTREYFEVEAGAPSDHSHLDYVVAWVEGGNTMRALVDAMGVDLGHEVSPALLSVYLYSNFRESEARLKQARARGAHSMLDDSISIVDEPQFDNVGVARAASRARTRVQVAERWNRAELGNQQQTNVAISITGLHIDALRAPRVTITQPAAPQLEDIVDADSVTIEDHAEHTQLLTP